jgi:uncharacterized protein
MVPRMIDVADDPAHERYVITVDGAPAGFAAYKRRPALIAFTHTEIDPAHEGEGLGGRLVAFALDDARRAGLAVLPFCPFVRGYVARHPEYVDLVPPSQRAAFDLPADGADG